MALAPRTSDAMLRSSFQRGLRPNQWTVTRCSPSFTHRLSVFHFQPVLSPLTRGRVRHSACATLLAECRTSVPGIESCERSVRNVDAAAATDFSWRFVLAAPHRFAYRRSPSNNTVWKWGTAAAGKLPGDTRGGDCRWQINQDLWGRPGSPHMQMNQVWHGVLIWCAAKRDRCHRTVPNKPTALVPRAPPRGLERRQSEKTACDCGQNQPRWTSDRRFNVNIDDINTSGGVDTDPHRCNEIFCAWISYFE